MSKLLFVLFAGLYAVNACIVDPETLFSKSSMKFATKVYNALATGAPGENFIFSPFSIQTSAAMLYSGAAGTTAEEIAKTLEVSTNNRDSVADIFQMILENHKEEQLEIANKIYINEWLKVDTEFHSIITEKFDSAAENIDFNDKENAKITINNWVRNVTHDKITEIVNSNSFNNNTLLILLNAIYFKGAWVNPFPPSFKGDFSTISNENKQIELMSTLDEFKIGVLPELDAQVLEMDYFKSNLSMMILLPKTKNGINDLEQKLSSADLLEISAQIKTDYIDVIVPKFKIEYSLDLQEPFEKIGMGRIFSDDADFSNMVHAPVKVGKALHKTFINVNEFGTEASGVTILDIRPKSIFPRFFATHPFIFAIKSKTAVLFLGRFLG